MLYILNILWDAYYQYIMIYDLHKEKILEEMGWRGTFYLY